MRTNWRRKPLFFWPPSSWRISHVVTFFQRQFIFRYFKNSFESDFQTVAAALAPSVAAFSSAPVVPAAMQSLFLGSQHSFDLILNAICNPLQDTEACSPTWCTFPIAFCICLSFSSALSVLNLFFVICYQQPFWTIYVPPTSVRWWNCYYIVLDAVITLLQGAAALLLVFVEDHIMTGAPLLNSRWAADAHPPFHYWQSLGKSHFKTIHLQQKSCRCMLKLEFWATELFS